MQLEDYFDFLSPTDIRLKGHRVGIDTVLSYYLEGYTPEEIAANLSTLNLEKIRVRAIALAILLAPLWRVSLTSWS